MLKTCSPCIMSRRLVCLLNIEKYASKKTAGSPSLGSASRYDLCFSPPYDLCFFCNVLLVLFCCVIYNIYYLLSRNKNNDRVKDKMSWGQLTWCTKYTHPVSALRRSHQSLDTNKLDIIRFIFVCFIIILLLVVWTFSLCLFLYESLKSHKMIQFSSKTESWKTESFLSSQRMRTNEYFVYKDPTDVLDVIYAKLQLCVKSKLV